MSIFRDFDDIPHGGYRVVLADPPWTFITRSGKGKGRSPEKHYPCMTIDEIKALPVGRLAAPSAALCLWITDPHLPLGLEVMDAWGFKYKTVAFTWGKLNKKALPHGTVQVTGRNGAPFSGPFVPMWSEDQFFTGMGYWTRANPEMCLFGTRGAPKRQHKDVRQLIVAKRREHSRKPDEQYDRITRLLPGPYLELFGRSEAPGWDVWSNEDKLFPVK